MGAFWRHVTGDSQLRWFGPDKGAVHLAAGAAVHAVWDLWAKLEGVSARRLVAKMTLAEIVRRIDFAKPRFIEEPTSPDDVEGYPTFREAIASIEVATGEKCQSRIFFKHSIARGAIDVVRLCIAGTHEGRAAEYVDRLHEHFAHPCTVRGAAYMPPRGAGLFDRDAPRLDQSARASDGLMDLGLAGRVVIVTGGRLGHRRRRRARPRRRGGDSGNPLARAAARAALGGGHGGSAGSGSDRGRADGRSRLRARRR